MIILDLMGVVIKFQLKIPPYELNLKYGFLREFVLFTQAAE
jgi:hypothetical protein